MKLNNDEISKRTIEFLKDKAKIESKYEKINNRSDLQNVLIAIDNDKTELFYLGYNTAIRVLAQNLELEKFFDTDSIFLKEYQEKIQSKMELKE